VSESLRVELIDTRSRLASLEDEWRQLLRNSTAPIFLTWEWLSVWWDVFGDDCQPWVWTVRLPDGRLIGLAPFARRVVNTRAGISYRVVTFLGAGKPSPDHLDLVVDADHRAAATDALTATLVPQCDRTTVLSLAGVAGGSALLACLGSLRGYRQLSSESCPFVRLPDNWDTYRRTLGAKLQSHLEYSIRRLEKEHPTGVGIDHIDSEADLDSAMEGLFQLHTAVREGHGDTGAFADERMRIFHQRVARLLLRNGWLRLYRLRVNDAAIAWLYCFRYKNVVSYYQSGYDQRWKRYSPGSLIIAHAIRSAIEEGAAEFDFLRGPEAYKLRWTQAVRDDFNLEYSRNVVRRLHHFCVDAAVFLRHRFGTYRERLGLSANT